MTDIKQPVSSLIREDMQVILKSLYPLLVRESVLTEKLQEVSQDYTIGSIRAVYNAHAGRSGVVPVPNVQCIKIESSKFYYYTPFADDKISTVTIAMQDIPKEILYNRIDQDIDLQHDTVVAYKQLRDFVYQKFLEDKSAKIPIEDITSILNTPDDLINTFVSLEPGFHRYKGLILRNNLVNSIKSGDDDADLIYEAIELLMERIKSYQLKAIVSKDPARLERVKEFTELDIFLTKMYL